MDTLKPNEDPQHPSSPNHTPEGRFKAGNKAGELGRGVPKREKMRERAAARRAAEEVRQAALERSKKLINSAIPDLVQGLRDRALRDGDNVAAGLLLKHGLPLSSTETSIAGMDDIAHLRPEVRIAAINARVASGVLPIEHGRALADLARSELDAAVVEPLRRLMLDLRKGIDPATAIKRLIILADDLEALEGDAELIVEPLQPPGEAIKDIATQMGEDAQPEPPRAPRRRSRAGLTDCPPPEIPEAPETPEVVVDTSHRQLDLDAAREGFAKLMSDAAKTTQAVPDFMQPPGQGDD